MRPIEVLSGDITRIPADAIVNSANTSLLAGGGVCGAIHRAAGADLERACRVIGSCPTGHAVSTPAFALPAKWVIHAVGPRWYDGGRGEPEALAECYRSIVAMADSLGARKVTLPSISTGIYRFPLDLAARIAVSTVLGFSSSIQSLAFVCFDENTRSAYDAALRAAS